MKKTTIKTIKSNRKSNLVVAPVKRSAYYFIFAENVIAYTRALGKVRTAETYATSLNSFKRYRNNRDIKISDITTEVIMGYEAYLKNLNICPNTISFYMRNIRSIYNRAVKLGVTKQQHPFLQVYTGIDKTIKRAISIKTLKKLKALSFTNRPSMEYARDMFLFSFYTRGMSFVDMAHLRKKDLNEGILSYHRCKTGQRLFIKWESCMQEIVDKYEKKDSIYLLPILNPTRRISERKQYIYASHNVNRNLKIIGQLLHLSQPLTMYVARHTWASVAQNKNIPLTVISKALGHDSESTTRIYLSSLDNNAIDKANKQILRSLL
ncbi:MAG: site-specific integrase [Bacteroidaceae bacterium]|nr:site-specific integrase [Bacteroidaceae bacterium]